MDKRFINGIRNYTPAGWLSTAVKNASSSGSYSDFVSKSNEATDGWYSVAANSIPVLRGIHNSILGRDSAVDYLSNTGLSWSDIPGYNASRLTGGTSSGVTSLAGDVHKIADGINDLGAFYVGDPKFTDQMFG